ncbi:aldose epimerase family protein [Segatella cerevisiae]|nr:aldose epimerase family protein [Segatella cerevisiae]
MPGSLEIKAWWLRKLPFSPSADENKSADPSYIHNKGERFMGPIVGRYANRIAKGTFSLDGKAYHLPINNNGQTLHGGLKGLDLVVWNVDSVTDHSIVMSYTSKDGEEGFPGNLKLKVKYEVGDNDEMTINYWATTDKPTVVNLSSHVLYNLKGEGNGTILDHLVTIYGDSITPIDKNMIPTGKIQKVDGSAFDFRRTKAIGQDINRAYKQLKLAHGYDHNWVLYKKDKGAIKLAVRVTEPSTDRVMEIYTDQPGLQFYSGNFMDGKVKCSNGKFMKYRESFAFEPQKYPDSPNHKNFPSTVLKPGEVYRQTSIYKFYVDK